MKIGNEKKKKVVKNKLFKKKRRGKQTRKNYKKSFVSVLVEFLPVSFRVAQIID